MNSESIQHESAVDSVKGKQCTSRSAGRWTKEEHQKFVEALKLFGKNWKSVEEYIGTRTGAQIRSHAQKFFNRLQRELGLENTTSSNLPVSQEKVHANLRKYSASSISTNNSIASGNIPSLAGIGLKDSFLLGNHSDEEDKECKTTEVVTIIPIHSHRKGSDDFRGMTHDSQNGNVSHRMQKLSLQLQYHNPLLMKDGTVRHGSFYESIMDKFRQFRKDSSDNLKLSDLVDMKSYDHVKPARASITSFRPAGSFRRGTVACFRPILIEEPQLLKKFKGNDDY